MVENKDIINDLTTAAPSADDAVGISKAKWFIAIVNNRSEKLNGERLTRMGIENYVPTQSELRVWNNGKRSMVEKVMIPSKIFIHCTECERREIVTLPFIFRFMTNKARASENSKNSPLAIVHNHEIEQLRFMLGVPNAEVVFTEKYVKGDKVKVVRGPFKGLIGVVMENTENKKSHLYINIDFLGSAYVEINLRDVVPFKG